MTVKYNVPGSKRKELAQTMANWLGCSVKYKGAPTFAYEVDYFTIDKNGALSFDDRADSEVIERLLEMLYDNGFEAESLPEADNTEVATEPTEPTSNGAGLVITIPYSKVGAGNLLRLLDVKGALIKKALEIDNLEMEFSDDSVTFLWFENKELTPEEIKAYTEFVSFLCQMTAKQQRVTSSEKTVENEKYAFRCFLLRLGFIGNEYKQSRKILLRNLNGSSAFKSGSKNETEASENA